MSRRIPIVATMVVLILVATMVGLGIWQLHRKTWKEAEIARYEKAQRSDVAVAWPASPAEYEGALYRRSVVNCAVVSGLTAMAGRSADGQPGWAHIAHCALPNGSAADVSLGWSTDASPPAWHGGPVTGWIVGSTSAIRLIASPPQAGLVQLEKPDPANVSTTPMGHLSYAIQWFFFALTALVIYVLALRRKWRE